MMDILGWLFKCYRENYSRGEPHVSISLPSQHVIGFLRRNLSMLIGFFKQKQTAKQRKWLFISADSSRAGMHGEPLRTCTWVATPSPQYWPINL